ncbi:EamA family transporter [Nocardia sp. XZ_19_385]|uniref:EamA family transporter n=1 Tax=Nocardia sp. XZ_19_385 TaxID=2769488 RepID=UPI00188DEECD|nr:EamA family transporter [Nocardia sp. XZ_19_385]
MSDSLLATVLALISALMHASWNAAVKSGTDRLTSMGMVDATALVVCAVAVPFVAPPNKEAWIFIGISTVLNTVFRLFMIKAYQLGDFGQMYPIMRGVPPLAVAVLSVVALNQSLTALAWAGVGLVSIGVVSLVLSNKVGAVRVLPVTYAVLAGLAIAGYTASDAGGVHAVHSLASYLVYLFLIESIPIPALAIAVRKQEAFTYAHRNWKVGLFGGVNALLSYSLILWALSLAPAAKVEALRETSVVLAAGIGALVFKESFGRSRVICSIVVAAGIVLISI